MRIMLVQYAGDFQAAHELLTTTGAETYYGHRYLLERLGAVAETFGPTAILCCKSPAPYDKVLPSGLRIIGAGAKGRWNTPETMRIVSDFAPTHLIVLGPLTPLIRWGLKADLKVLCVFADSFEINPLRRLFRFGRIGAVLNDPRVAWIGNHGIGASQSLARIGVDPDKILPWDWPQRRQPDDFSIKASAGPAPHTLFYAGLVTERKGIRDAITALSILNRDGKRFRLEVAGGGEIEKYEAVAKSLGVGGEVAFLGLIPNDSVVARMRAAAAVVVPSQHAYPEGLPLTIYEALCARTPVVVSDHPMFVRRLRHGETALVYRSGKPAELAACLQQLIDEPALYERLSTASQGAWEGLQIQLKWGDLIWHWLSGREEDRAVLWQHRLAAMR